MEVTEVSTPSKKNFKQAQLPFKAMDIRSALKTSKRKRKTDDSLSHSEPKSQKVDDSPCVKKWEVVLINCCASSDSKNTILNGSCSPSELKQNAEMQEQNAEMKESDDMEMDKNEDTEGNTEVVKGDSCVENDISHSDSDSDETDSAAVENSTTNVSLNNSVSSADLEDDPEDKDVQSSQTNSSEPKSDTENHEDVNEISSSIDATKTEVAAVTSRKANDPPCQSEPRKRRKMSPEEAKLKAERRVQQLKEKEEQKVQKEKEILAKKEEKRLEKERKQQEIQKKKEEKQKKKELEEKLRLEKKEQEEKEKQRKLQEKEEKNRLKQQQLEAKMEEKKKKEEEKMKALEEKKKKEEQRLKALEEKKKAEEEKKKAEEEKRKAEEKKIEKTKAAFASFFLKGKAASPSQVSGNTSSDQGYFRPFQVKENMSLAPIVPQAAQERFNKESLEQLISMQACQELYLDALRSGEHQNFRYKKFKSKKIEDSDADVVMLDCKENEEAQADLCLKAKLLQFCDNIRPPYWGTWRKTSKNVKPRNPFGKDVIFDYEVDSDDEWDEGGPGESLSGTEDEESEDDYEVDNEFFVPHGYLSPEEEKDDEDDAAANDPELQRVRLKMKEREFENERSKKTTQLKPSIIGCFWEMDSESGNPLCAKSLQPYCAIVLVAQPIATTFSMPKSKADDSSLLKPDRAGLGSENSPKTPGGSKRPVPEEAIPYLVQLLHANTNGRSTVVKEFQEFWRLHCMKEDSSNKNTEASLANALTPAQNEKCVMDSNQTVHTKPQPYKISVAQLNLTIREISEWCRCPNASLKKYCWWVHEKVREKYGFVDLPVPNKWNYVTRKESENTLPVAQGASSLKGFLNI